MKYYSLNGGTVKITLSEEDMKKYSLCAEGIALQTAESKRSLADMLKKIRLFSEHSAERLFLEAFPVNEGGCVLYVSGLDEEKTEEHSAKIPLMCYIENLESLIRLCRCLVFLGKAESVCVYYGEGGYTAAVTAEAEEEAALKRLFLEYGSLREACFSEEYEKKLCTESICKRLAELY